MLVSVVYGTVCNRLLEPGGFQLGLVTEAQFLVYFADVINAFLRDTGISKLFVTQQIVSGTGSYVTPDRLTEPAGVFTSGRFTARSTLDSIDASIFNWRTKTGEVKVWHEDGLPINTVQLVPAPNWTGTAIAPPGYTEITGAGTIPAADRNITVYGATLPVQLTYVLADTIPLLPDSAAIYLAWGILEKIYSDDSELKDRQKATYCSARFFEGKSVFRTVMKEELGDDDEE